MTSPTTPTTSWPAAPSPSGNNGRPAPSPTVPPATPPQPSPTRATANPATTQQLPVVGQPIILRIPGWVTMGAIFGWVFGLWFLFTQILPGGKILGTISNGWHKITDPITTTGMIITILLVLCAGLAWLCVHLARTRTSPPAGS